MNEHLHPHYIPHHHEIPVEQPQPKFSAPMMVIEGDQLVIKQKV